MFLLDTNVLSVDETVAQRCAMLQVPDPHPERDSFIAATALAHSLVLVTRNVRDFAETGVEMLNPWSGQAWIPVGA